MSSQGTPNCSISVTHNHLYKQIKNKLIKTSCKELKKKDIIGVTELLLMKRHVIGRMNSCKEVERKIIIYYLSIASIITGLVFVMNMHLQVKLHFTLKMIILIM